MNYLEALKNESWRFWTADQDVELRKLAVWAVSEYRFPDGTTIFDTIENDSWHTALAAAKAFAHAADPEQRRIRPASMWSNEHEKAVSVMNRAFHACHLGMATCCHSSAFQALYDAMYYIAAIGGHHGFTPDERLTCLADVWKRYQEIVKPTPGDNDQSAMATLLNEGMVG